MRRWIPKPPAAAPSVLFTENYEGSNTDSQGKSGYDNPNWGSNDASIDPAYATSPAPLQGAHSLLLPQQNMYISRTLSGITTFYGSFWYGNYGTLDNFQSAYQEVLDSGATSISHMEVRPSGAVRLHCGSQNQDTATGLVTAGATRYFWHDIDNTGATTVAKLYISSTTTKPGSPSVTTDAGSKLNNPDNIRLRGTSTGAGIGIVDHFLYNNATIGSNP